MTYFEHIFHHITKTYPIVISKLGDRIIPRLNLISVDPHKGLYQKEKSVTAAVMHQITSRKTFKVLLANFTKYLLKWNAETVGSTSEDHLRTISKSQITHGKIICILENDTRSLKGRKSVRDISNVNKHVFHSHFVKVGDKEEGSITFQNMEI